MSDERAQLEQDAIEYASRAVHFDAGGNIDPAIFYYREAAQSLKGVLFGGSPQPGLQRKIMEYLDRVEYLVKLKDSDLNQQIVNNEQQLQLDRAHFLLLQAFEEDEAGNKQEAFELYTQAVELCLQARNNTKDNTLQEKLTNIATQALDRAESLKTSLKTSTGSESAPKPVSPRPARANQRTVPPLGIGNLNLNTQSDARPSHLAEATGVADQFSKTLQISGSDSYTKEELEVLRITSVINGREYVPFMNVDLKERFAFPIPFSDKDGKLALAPKQRSSFSHWVKPEDLTQNPKVIELIDCFSIRQTVVSDCSFVASLAVSALYEKRFKKKLITKIIYPQNRNGEPVYNPCGKYMIKLNINGVPRKVVIDDLLPMGHSRELLCSYSNNKSEFWVSLLEKAYMKVMGGYDFPGSNSNIDLHALTSWIPERESIRPNEPDFNSEALFRKLFERHHKGDVLVTLATGELSDTESERTGLVSTHAYAMLDVREVQGKKLFLVKNPWSHLRWKGRYSERDTQSWTPSLREALKYDPHNASMFDNGVFWIDYESVCHFFDVAYLNWNPALFKYTYCIHQTWKAGAGPTKDLYNIGENPQYHLEVSSPGSAVWILLTRHITDRDDFANNREYIAVLVYKNGGKKVYLPFDPPPFIDGVRINSPHYLCKILIPTNGSTSYTLVVSQYEKTSTIHYTLRVYSTCPFHLSKIGSPYKYLKEDKHGEWTELTAGGCGNHPETYNRNPVYQVALESSGDENQLLITLKGPKQYQIGIDVVTVNINNASCQNQFSRKSSGVFRSGITILEIEQVPAGIYNIIPSTFHPGQRSPFFLTVQSTCPIKFSRIK